VKDQVSDELKNLRMVFVGGHPSKALNQLGTLGILIVGTTYEYDYLTYLLFSNLCNESSLIAKYKYGQLEYVHASLQYTKVIQLYYFNANYTVY